MIEVRQTLEFKDWLGSLKDRMAAYAIAARLERLAYGLKGDVKPVGDGISELRVHVGPGYRVYFVQRGQVLIVVLSGGDKGSQDRDIASAKVLARNL